MKKFVMMFIVLAMAATLFACTSSPPVVESSESEDIGYFKDGQDIHLYKSGTVLANMTIAGNLYIDEAVGDGEYTLEHLVVAGDLIINGSGSKSGHLIDVQGSRLIISSQTNPRVVLDMETSFEGVQIASDCIIESEGEISGQVTVNNDKTEEAIKIMLTGSYPEVTLESTAHVTLNGEISLMRVLQSAGMTDIKMVDASRMYFFSNYGQSVSISGGTIIEAWINAEYCSLPEDVSKIASEVGVADVRINDISYVIPKSASEQAGNTEDAPTPACEILLDGYPLVESNNMIISITSAAYEKSGLYVLVESQEVGAMGTTPENVRDGISAGAGMTMQDGNPYIVIHQSFSIDNILTEQTHKIDMDAFLQEDGVGDNPKTATDMPNDSTTYVFIVAEDLDGNLSRVYEFIR